MSVRTPLGALKVRATSMVAALLMVGAFGAGVQPNTALAQEDIVAEGIPSNLTKLRPIKGIAYDPKPSDFFQQNAYFDSDFFNSDLTGIWGDDGPGSRQDLELFKTTGLNFLHLYNWNAQRVNHTVFLDAAQARGITVMVPISNFTAGTIVGVTPGCGTCPKGYQAAFKLVTDIFNQVYRGTTSPHPAVAMWGIFNEYDLNKINPANVVFVIQAILTLENQAGIPVASRLPITVPVSDAIFARSVRQALDREQLAAFERATRQWLESNPGKNVDTVPGDLPGAVLAILAISNALADAQTRTTYKAVWDPGEVTVAAVPADFWRTRFIASSNPFRQGPDLRNYLLSPTQFQSAFPGTTAWNTLPPLFFAELGFSQVDAGRDLQRQESIVLKQLQCTNPLAVQANTPQGYFLGSAFFQHTFVDVSHFEAFQVVPGQFTLHGPSDTAPCPACGQRYRVDVLTALPQAASVQQGYADDAATCQ
jgi:hypothetical protein